MVDQKKCIDVVCKHWESRREDLDLLFRLYHGEEVGENENSEGYDEDSLFEYGLSFDYVAPGTFADQDEGYWRYQISWGGPSEEIRFYSSSPTSNPYKVEFWFLDWGDGAKKHIKGDEVATMLWEFFSETGTTEAEYTKAMEE